MILHNCIKCDYFEMIPIAPLPLPCFQKYICPQCKELQWIKHSRISPETYSNDSVEIDEETKQIKIKDDDQTLS